MYRNRLTATGLLPTLVAGLLSGCLAENETPKNAAESAGFSAPVSVAAPAKSDALANAAGPTVEVVPQASAALDSLPEQAFPGQHGAAKKGEFNTPYGLLELPYEEINGVAVVGGDLIFPLPENSLRTAIGEAASSITSNPSLVWNNGMVTVGISGITDAALAARVEEAVQFWEQNSQVRFIRNVPLSADANQIRFMQDANADSASSTFVGNGGYGGVWVGTNVDAGRIKHEIGHVPGLFHEHQRNDKANYVSFHSECLSSSSYVKEYTSVGSKGIDIGPYDVTSIMHYGSWDLNNGCAPLTRLDGSTFGRQRSYLTASDYNSVRSLYLPWFLRQQAVDYDGDGLTDLSNWTPATGTWSIVGSTGITRSIVWGQRGDVPVPGYYDTFAGADLAYWNRATGQWHIRDSFGADNVYQLGTPEDVPVPADYDRDGYTNPAVWNPYTGQWTISGLGVSAPWGIPTDIPVPADYDGDGAADLAVYRPSSGQWFVSNNLFGSGWVAQWGQPGDIPVPADFDGDRRADLAIWRPSTGQWWVINSSTWSGWVAEWGVGAERDVPVPGHYTANGGVAADMAIWRGSTGVWWIRADSAGGAYRTPQLGAVGDVPLP